MKTNKKKKAKLEKLKDQEIAEIAGGVTLAEVSNDPDTDEASNVPDTFNVQHIPSAVWRTKKK